MAVSGGNWQIFSTMLERCNTSCAVVRETTVASISQANRDDSRYTLSTKTATESDASPYQYPIEFDSVIVATPWQYAGISAADGLLAAPIEEIKYRHLHVTLFTTAHRLSREYFGLGADAKIPTSVLTTRTPNGEDKAGFISVSTVGGFKNPMTGVDEWVYKIFSMQPVTPEFVSSILSVILPDAPLEGKLDGPISWYYPHVFNSYPILETKSTFQDPVLADRLYYTSGIESFISTMETSALMGKNVAQLAWDDMRTAKPRAHSHLGQQEDQHVLADSTVGRDH